MDEPDVDFFAMLEVADRFGCTQMKLACEYELTTAVLNESNAADMLVFADAHNCAQLREAAVDIFRAKPNLVMASVGWVKVAESVDLLQELMKILACSDNEAIGSPESVSELRKQLYEKGLDVDGSLEMLVDRLANA